VQRREIPSVDLLLRSLGSRYEDIARPRLTSITRAVLEAVRSLDLPVEEIEAEIHRRVEALRRPSLRRVINATGVVLHTNLGRAPLKEFHPVEGYSNLEYDLQTGKRGKRDVHLAPLLQQLLGVPAIAVNNNAAATYLVLRALATGGEVLVSRGELVEIGDGFRIPDIMQESGAVLREVGATNRTHIEDYRKAIGEGTKLIMRVHPSNFHQTGFVGKPSLADLARLAREHSLPCYEDLGSGCLLDLRAYGIEEPLVGDSLRAGVHLVSFSCDKLLGGPQAGIIAGDAELVARIRRHPMYRAFRLDKLAVEALSEALRALARGDYHALPGPRMISMPLAEIETRARNIAARIGRALVRQGRSVIGGGSTPDQSIPTWLVAIPGDARRLERYLRTASTPVVARIENDELLLDPRTIFPADDDTVAGLIESYARSM
jgi:L-seryl-tRNA(Ser) seleniumtransferase